DELGRELMPDEIRDFFLETFVNVSTPLQLADYELRKGEGETVICEARLETAEGPLSIEGKGNGPINALVHALDGAGKKTFQVTDYQSHAVRGGSDADSAAYVQIRSLHEEKTIWGCGMASSIEKAGLLALFSAMNLMES
ncbi:MAG: alpha-isopropylmalate synthase regulatory domain-containing protein, partial [Verrucomicrobiota bacterium]